MTRSLKFLLDGCSKLCFWGQKNTMEMLPVNPINSLSRNECKQTHKEITIGNERRGNEDVPRDGFWKGVDYWNYTYKELSFNP